MITLSCYPSPWQPITFNLKSISPITPKNLPASSRTHGVCALPSTPPTLIAQSFKIQPNLLSPRTTQQLSQLVFRLSRCLLAPTTMFQSMITPLTLGTRLSRIFCATISSKTTRLSPPTQTATCTSKLRLSHTT